MGRLDRLRQRLLTLPAEMDFREVDAVLKGDGYRLDRADDSHRQYTKPGWETQTLSSHKGKVQRYQLRQIADKIRQPGE